MYFRMFTTAAYILENLTALFPPETWWFSQTQRKLSCLPTGSNKECPKPPITAENCPFFIRTQLPKTDDNSKPKGYVSAWTITHDLSSQRLKYYYYQVMDVLIPGVKNI